MLRSLLAVTALLISSCSMAWTGSAYVAPSINYISIRGSNESGYIGMTGQLALGYSTVVSNWIYLAAEAFASSKAVTIDNTSSSVGSLRPQYSYGGYLIPGIVLDYVVMAYGKLGVISTRFNNINVTRGGYQAGGGVQVNVCGNWNVEAEYIYTRYHSINGAGSPSVDQFGAGLVYRFS